LEVALETPRLKTRALSESKNYIEIYFNTVSHTKHPKNDDSLGRLSAHTAALLGAGVGAAVALASVVG
jgi:hypothetical protein